MLRTFRLRSAFILSIVGFATGAAAEDAKRATAAPSDDRLATEAPFLSENGAAMDKMMADMNVKPTGDVDADFSAMMIPHHQGAIDMAITELRYGKNEQLRRIAQEIIVGQQQEIVAMHMALGQALPPPAAAQTQVLAAHPAAAHNHSSISDGAMSMPTAPTSELQMMNRALFLATLLTSTLLASTGFAGQAPGAASVADIPVSHHDRVYASEQFSNTVSVTDPVDNKLLGVIRLGDPQPGNFSPLYRGQVLVHGMGFSPDHHTLAIVSIGSNSVTFIDTATNAVKHTTYVGRSPHEAFFTPDGNEVWVTVRGEDYISVLDAKTYEETTRIKTPNGPGMQIFSPDGKYGYICSSFNPEIDVVTVTDHKIVAKVKQDSPFCPNIAATTDGKQVWFTLKDVGKTQIFDARPPFELIKSIDTGPITNHVNFAQNANAMFAYVTIGGLNEVKVYRIDNFEQVATIPVGILPHGIWPSGDGSRIYVGLENGDALAAIDTITNKVVANVPVGQAPQAIAYVPNAIMEGPGTDNLQPLGLAGQVAHLNLSSVKGNSAGDNSPTSVSLFDQGLIQIFQAAAIGLEPKKPYLIGLSEYADGHGAIQPLSAFMTNPAGSAIVNVAGPIRQLVQTDNKTERRYLVIAEGTAAQPGAIVQIQSH